MNPTNESRFASASSDISMRRSTFKRPTSVKTTFNSSLLIPFYVDEILPGDTIKLTVDAVVRSMTPLYPTMDNAFLDLYAFFVPNRLSWDHWREFMGENNTDFWSNKTEYQVPCISIDTHGQAQQSNFIGSFWDYVGVGLSKYPTDTAPFSKPLKLNALYPRGYARIFNDWFRDENTQTPAHIYTDDTDRSIGAGQSASSYVVAAEYGAKLCPVNKFHDLFTSALPGAQKHAPISLPLGQYAPVTGTLSLPNQTVTNDTSPVATQFSPMWRSSLSPTGEWDLWATRSSSALGTTRGKSSANNPDDPVLTLALMSTGGSLDVDGKIQADLSEATAATINQIRLAFQTQKFYERQARSGSRYTEVIRSFFGVRSPDARLQRSEYLGGKRIPINQYQVAQTSQGTDASPLAQTGAYSLTGASAYLCNKSFTEHGILYVVGCVRPSHTYSQGINKIFTHRQLFDYYFPTFAYIGEQPILNREIYAQGTVVDEEGFAYQEAYYEYRYKNSYVSGYMRPNVTQTLAAWHYGDNFASLPILSDQFIRETPTNIDRTLTIGSDQMHQYFADFFFNNKSTRVMPLFSVPGLVDHF